MDAEIKSFYFIKDYYFAFANDSFLMKNKEDGKSRPCFSAVRQVLSRKKIRAIQTIDCEPHSPEAFFALGKPKKSIGISSRPLLFFQQAFRQIFLFLTKRLEGKIHQVEISSKFRFFTFFESLEISLESFRDVPKTRKNKNQGSIVLSTKNIKPGKVRRQKYRIL